MASARVAGGQTLIPPPDKSTQCGLSNTASRPSLPSHSRHTRISRQTRKSIRHKLSIQSFERGQPSRSYHTNRYTQPNMALSRARGGRTLTALTSNTSMQFSLSNHSSLSSLRSHTRHGRKTRRTFKSSKGRISTHSLNPGPPSQSYRTNIHSQSNRSSRSIHHPYY